MAHIQRGDERQYIGNNVATEDYSGAVASMFNQGMNGAVSITQKANESTLANNQIQYSNECFHINNQINTKWQADPTNPQREVELKEAFQKASEKYKINPVCQGQWKEIVDGVNNRFSQYNAQWQEKQMQTNIQTNLKNGYESLTNQISMLGMNGAGVDEIRLVYANGIEGLRNGAVAGLGEVVVNEFLKDSNHDIMATYISALALNNPLQAQQLLKDKGVRDDIGRAETLEKLENYVNSSMTNLSKRNAVEQFGNVLRNMNSKEADDILKGNADLNKVMKFIEKNKGIPEGSKDLLLNIYGINSSSDYFYNRDKKIIEKKPERGSSGGSGGMSLKDLKLNALQKADIAETLQNDLHDMISFSGKFSAFNLPSVKEINKQKKGQEAQAGLFAFMKNVAGMQGRIDSAYASKSIDASTRKRLMNDFIAPVSAYMEQNLSQLDEKSWTQKKLGYGRIQEQFNTKGLKGDELREMERQKLFAQNYYLQELNKVVAKTPHLTSIFDIEKLPSNQQKEIYKVASENALKQAKRWTDKPEYFFAREYPQIYSQPFVYLGQAQSLMINRTVAEATYRRAFEDENGKSTLDLTDFAQNKMYKEINKTALENRRKAGDLLRLKDMEMSIHRPDPVFDFDFSTNPNAIHNRLKNDFGLTWKEFQDFAINKGYVSATSPKGSTQGYIQAFRDLSYSKALKERNKK